MDAMTCKCPVSGAPCYSCLEKRIEVLTGRLENIRRIVVSAPKFSWMQDKTVQSVQEQHPEFWNSLRKAVEDE